MVNGQKTKASNKGANEYHPPPSHPPPQPSPLHTPPTPSPAVVGTGVVLAVINLYPHVFHAVAALILLEAALTGALVVLVPLPGRAKGVLVAEVALRRPQPQRQAEEAFMARSQSTEGRAKRAFVGEKPETRGNRHKRNATFSTLVFFQCTCLT